MPESCDDCGRHDVPLNKEYDPEYGEIVVLSKRCDECQKKRGARAQEKGGG